MFDGSASRATLATGLIVVVTINYWAELRGIPGARSVILYLEDLLDTEGISFLWAMPLSLLVQVVVGMLVSLLPIGRRPKPAE